MLSLIGFYETLTSVNFRASSTKTAMLDEGGALYVRRAITINITLAKTTLAAKQKGLIKAHLSLFANTKTVIER